MSNDPILDLVKEALFEKWADQGLDNEDVKKIIASPDFHKNMLEVYKLDDKLKRASQTDQADFNKQAGSLLPALGNLMFIAAPDFSVGTGLTGGALLYYLLHGNEAKEKAYKDRKKDLAAVRKEVIQKTVPSAIANAAVIPQQFGVKI